MPNCRNLKAPSAKAQGVLRPVPMLPVTRVRELGGATNHNKLAPNTVLWNVAKKQSLQNRPLTPALLSCLERFIYTIITQLTVLIGKQTDQ